MAEHFYGEEFTVDFSNGGVESFYRGLVALARRLPATKALLELQSFLQYQLDNPFAGFRAFSLKELPDELSPENLAEFARLVEMFCLELAKKSPELEATEIDWDEELRFNWLAKLLNLHSLIENLLRKKGSVIASPEIQLSPDDEAAVKLRRMEMIYHQKKLDFSPSQRIDYYKQIVRLVEKDKYSQSGLRLSAVYLEYAGLLDENVVKEEKIATWKRILEIETGMGDAAGIGLAREFLQEIEKE